MKRRFSFGDLHFGRRKAALLRALLQPPSKERLSAAVLAPHRLERAGTTLDRCQLGIKRRLERVKTDGQHVEARIGDRAPPERRDDLFPSFATERHRTSTSNCCSSSGRLRMTVSDASSTSRTWSPSTLSRR